MQNSPGTELAVSEIDPKKRKKGTGKDGCFQEIDQISEGVTSEGVESVFLLIHVGHRGVSPAVRLPVLVPVVTAQLAGPRASRLR
jgi:hypothetical protein